jgi:peroxiredoxin Q/BCP
MLRTFLRRLVTDRRPRLLPIDSAAPDFDVPDHDGNAVRLADLVGTRFVLWFYPKADTPG